MIFSIGVISDTHGLLRPEVKGILETCDTIIHAGDIGSEEILNTLKAISPTYAVRGNVDRGDWTENLPLNDVIEVAGKFFYITHIPGNIDLDPVAAGIDIVIYGHTHTPEIFKEDAVLYVNPGSAGPKRFTKPVSLCRITIEDHIIKPEIIHIQ